jgi:hypothetical protein
VAIADAIGRRSSMSSSQLEDLRAAAFLHDVGHMTLAAEGQNFEAPGHAEEGERIVAGAKFPPRGGGRRAPSPSTLGWWW